MTTLDRIRHARRALTAALGLRALLVALAAGLFVLAVGLVADTVVAIPANWRRATLPVALVIGGVVLAVQLLTRVRAALRATDEQVALWFEGRMHGLRYALVTSVDERAGAHRPVLDALIATAPLERVVRVAAGRALTRPAALVLVLLTLLLFAPTGAVARLAVPQAGDALTHPGAAARALRDPLASVVVRVVPPAYSGLPVAAYDDPSTIVALVGSRVTIEGMGGGVRAVVGADTVRAAARGGAAEGWRLVLSVPDRALAVRLRGPQRERLLVIDPRADSVPNAQLVHPVRDSVMRAATAPLALEAELRDDLGLAEGAFEFIVSSGSGESFTFRSSRVAVTRFDAGVRHTRIEGVLRLDTLKLAPGDLVHIRAVATDRNDLSGPGLGVSETRTLRIARADEYDSVAVDPMPPTEPEKNALSQRMILQMTQALHAREPRISAAELQRESRRIGLEQTRLRKRVGEVVFLRLGEDQGEHSHFAGDGHEHGAEGATRMLESEGDETPVVAINRPLLEAYNHMWRASSELETARPGAAIPWMERAIEALQRARAAERIYLKGRPPSVVLDLAKVRGTGKERSATGARAPRAPLDAEREARLTRFDRVLDLVASDAGAAADSLLLLRLSLPEEDRGTARALDLAADALRRGGEVTAALQGARRALSGAPVRTGALLLWGG